MYDIKQQPNPVPEEGAIEEHQEVSEPNHEGGDAEIHEGDQE